VTLTPVKTHPTAIVHPGAQLGVGVEIGPYAVIGENVTIGDGTWVGPHAIVEGWTTIGRNCKIFPSACVGLPPQDMRYKGDRSWVHVGDDNMIREFVTVHRAYELDGETRIGHRNLIMAYAHIAHNCILGSDITIANLVTMAGHVEIHDQAVIGGMAGILQFVRVGRLAMVGGLARVIKDILPYATVAGQPARNYGLNVRGLKRRNIGVEARRELKSAFRVLTGSGLPLPAATAEIQKGHWTSPEIQTLLAFLENPSKMGILIRDSKSGRRARHEDED
jgi:UDP-N-acetylglucosamine acyltransferase